MQAQIGGVRLRVGLSLVTFSIILTELSLVRTFDVILNPIVGYTVITSAMFAMGLGGVFVYTFRSQWLERADVLPKLLLALAVCVVIFRPVVNHLPFSLNDPHATLTREIFGWAAVYFVIVVPFFIAGAMVSMVFAQNPEKSHGLYFFDLIGAGLGCVLLMILIPPYGPGGILVVTAGVLVVSAWFFSRAGVKTGLVAVLVAIIAVLIPLHVNGYLEFSGHSNKRDTDNWIKEGKREYVRWDPVSKLEVFRSDSHNAKYFALDGGSQASWMLHFNGNYKKFDDERKKHPHSYFFGINSIAHYFKRDQGSQVLVIGAAVGGETLAALAFGAKHVDAIDLVGAMIRAAKGRFAAYSGQVFNNPKVNYRVGEGRTFLRSTNKKYDIIQMFSNNTSSSIAEGSGAMMAAYLQTAAAYKEYFTHLQSNGVLQVNHHLYPRMMVTAALAWHQMGRKDFARHVLVIESWWPDNLPTMLIKMSPWTQAEVNEIYDYVTRVPFRYPPFPANDGWTHRIYAGHPYTTHIISQVDNLSGLKIHVGTFRQPHLDYPVDISVFGKDGKLITKQAVPGDSIKDLSAIKITFPPVPDSRAERFKIQITSDNPLIQKAFVVFESDDLGAHIITIPNPPHTSFRIAFNPLDLSHNLIPASFLKPPFPSPLAARAEYRLVPVTDDKPQFDMIRKKEKFFEANNSPYMDGGTALFLNVQKLPFLSSDVLGFVIIAIVSVFFSGIFTFVPLKFSSVGRERWPGRWLYLVYFSCLGAGFIIIELTFIQIFRKLVGFPTHTFAVVIFSLLAAAGAGSILSRRWHLHTGSRWRWIFLAIIGIGTVFVFGYDWLFYQALSYTLYVRILVAFLMIAPLGFFLGMPFPLGIDRLGAIEPRGIPWAWGMNGFFTVFGGFLGLVLSFWIGFHAVLLLGVAAYVLAFATYALIGAKEAVVLTNVMEEDSTPMADAAGIPPV